MAAGWHCRPGCQGRARMEPHPSRASDPASLRALPYVPWFSRGCFLHPDTVPRIAPAQMTQLYFSVSNSVIAASWKVATLVIYGVYCSC